MMWVLIMLTAGITLAILCEEFGFDVFVKFIAGVLIGPSLACIVVSPVIIKEKLGHTETVSVRYTD